jgi:hypothetical protein
MGTFLALSSVIGRTQSVVVSSLTNYSKSVGGGLRRENNIDSDSPSCCIVQEENGNTSIFYPDSYLEWDDSSAFISKELEAKVFSFHIHDGDLWMYILYDNGNIIDQFNPIPDYWDENISEKEITAWKGNAQTIVNAVPYVKINDIDKYLIRWDLDEEEPPKAYPTDRFEQEDWQLVDFMSKLKLPYPVDDDGLPVGDTYLLWTSQSKLAIQEPKLEQKPGSRPDKPWWKFW